ncbi:MAG: sulfatase [Alphaproteobacteria bacterium]|nr:sulfatase [Alphaproteobacteria bacterium]
MSPVRRALLAAVVVLASACRRDPDVVFITVDTLRADHVGFLNPASPAATPAMDALAADGVVFTQAWSPISVTGPAFATLHTGQDPSTHGVVLNLFRGGPDVSAETETLAERLTAAGFQSGAFVSGFTLRPKLGLDQGFARYDAPTGVTNRRPGNQTRKRLERWVDDRERGDRLFLWFHSYDAHGPLTPYADAAPSDGDWIRDPEQLPHLPQYQRDGLVTDPAFYAARYAAAVSFADRQVAGVVRKLKDEGRYKDALIVLTADHGETFDERPLWFDHGTHASAEQLHVPLVVKFPRGASPADLPRGTRVDRLVTLADVAPTVLEVLGLPPLPAADGVSLLRADHHSLVGESSHCKAVAVLDCWPRGPGGKEFSLRTADRTVLRQATADGVRWRTYDRSADPAERSEESDRLPDAEDRSVLDAVALDRQARGLALPGGEEGEHDDADEVEALRALGYVDEAEREAPEGVP